MSLQRLYDDQIHILCQQGRKVGEGHDGSLGKFQHHTSGELLSISHLKIWGDAQEPCNDMAYILVCTGDTLEAQNYGMSLVWISPHQVWASTIEEAVGTLSAYIFSGPNWPYALAQLYEGSSHTPLPKGKHLGILPQGKAEESPYGQINQLEVCQLLSARPQVVYPMGLNGNESRSPSLCQNCYIAVPALLEMSIYT